MNAIPSHPGERSLREIINQQYPVGVEQVVLHRDMIGYVYLASSGSKQYVLKHYRSFDTENALRSIEIIQYLQGCGYPVVSIVPTRAGALHVTIDTPQGPSVAILFDYLEGDTPDTSAEIEALGRQTGWLHRLMDDFPGARIRRGKDFYIDRYLTILRALQYDPRRIDALDAYGSALWSRMACLPAGFCHGDLHTGNMLKTAPERYVLFDFDVASHTTPVIDVATLCDEGDFNHFSEAAYGATMHMFERFYRGYSREHTLTGPEISAIFDFIAVRHFEIIATITACQGLHELSTAFLDEQYDWLMRWKTVCER